MKISCNSDYKEKRYKCQSCILDVILHFWMYLPPYNKLYECEKYDAAVENRDGKQIHDKQRYADKGHKTEHSGNSLTRAGRKSFLYCVAPNIGNACGTGYSVFYIDAFEKYADAFYSQCGICACFFYALPYCRKEPVAARFVRLRFFSAACN